MTEADFPPDLDDCTSDTERAQWLLTAPLDRLIRDQNFIRFTLRAARFQAGLAYLDAEFSHLREPRREDGWPLNGIAIAAARGRLNRIASGKRPLNTGA